MPSSRSGLAEIRFVKRRPAKMVARTKFVNAWRSGGNPQIYNCRGNCLRKRVVILAFGSHPVKIVLEIAKDFE
jgi:hypothetical protein